MSHLILRGSKLVLYVPATCIRNLHVCSAKCENYKEACTTVNFYTSIRLFRSINNLLLFFFQFFIADLLVRLSCACFQRDNINFIVTGFEKSYHNESVVAKNFFSIKGCLSSSSIFPFEFRKATESQGNGSRSGSNFLRTNDTRETAQEIAIRLNTKILRSD